MGRAAVLILSLPEAPVLNLSHDELSPSRRTCLLWRWIVVIALRILLLLQPLLLSANPNPNPNHLTPIVLHEHTFAITSANLAIKSANSRTTINQSLTIGSLPHTIDAAIPHQMYTAIIE